MNSLTHYGVKGMKWGVRKEYVPHPRKKSATQDAVKNKISSNLYRKTKQNIIDDQDREAPKTDADYQKYLKRIAIGSAAFVGITGAVFLAYKYDAVDRIYSLVKAGGQVDSSGIKKAMDDALHDSDVVFKKGKVFHRQVAYKDIDFSKIDESTYVSATFKDRLKYMGELADWSGTDTRYDVALKAVQEIRAPSKETAVKIFDQMVREDPKYVDKLRKSLTEAYDYMYKDDPQSKAVELKKMNASIKNGELFDLAMYAMIKRGEDSKQYIDRLKSHGYNAMEDYFDKGVMADKPMILFDPSSSVVKIGEKEVTQTVQLLALLGSSVFDSITDLKEGLKE